MLKSKERGRKLQTFFMELQKRQRKKVILFDLLKEKNYPNLNDKNY